MTLRTLAGLAVALVASGCTVSKTETPALTGPSELATAIALSATPDVLRQDGASQSRIQIEARDANGQPIRGLVIRLEITVNGVIVDFGALTARDVVTGTDGKAFSVFTAPPAPAEPVDTGTIVTILATPVGTDNRSALARSVDIRLVPPGIILPPNGVPVPSFTVSPSTPSQFVPVLFDASASRDDGVIVSYLWSFGDGNTGSGRTVTHSFDSSGVFSVTLTVTDDRGLSASITRTVSVTAALRPTASFVFSPTAPAPNQTVFFNASASTAGPGRRLIAFDWDFGDGARSSGITTSHAFSAAGTFNVTLTVTDDAGQVDSASQSVVVTVPGAPTADFTFSPTDPTTADTVFFRSTSTSTAPIVRHQWAFGDGTTAQGETAQHRYSTAGTYTVTLRITDANGGTATASKTVAVSDAAIVADFSFSPTDPIVGQTVNFDGSDSTGPDPIVSYTWNFGDGSATASGQTTSHAYATPNTFTVRLTITDSKGRTATTTKDVTVGP